MGYNPAGRVRHAALIWDLSATSNRDCTAEGKRIATRTNTLLLMFAISLSVMAASPNEEFKITARLTVQTPLQRTNTPLDPTIDFARLIQNADRQGVVDPNSMKVIDTATQQRVPHAVTEDFAYSNKGRIEFVIADPKSNNGVYPYEKERPFFWRTGAAIADFNGDSLMDIATHDGLTRVATLFVQDRGSDGDGKPDLIACVEWSVYPWYSHAALTMEKRPDYFVEIVNDGAAEP